MMSDSERELLEALSPYEILGLTIIGEARGEPIEGQIAVGCTIRNRLRSNPHRYKSYTDVCLAPLQFSCWNKSDPNRSFLLDLARKMVNSQTIADLYLKQCLFVARGIVDGFVIDTVKGGKNYMTTDLFNSSKRPGWADNPKDGTIIKGKQTFFDV
jgi:N-acetylmuramoyl-L-alanine amidase